MLHLHSFLSRLNQAFTQKVFAGGMLLILLAGCADAYGPDAYGYAPNSYYCCAGYYDYPPYNAALYEGGWFDDEGAMHYEHPWHHELRHREEGAGFGRNVSFGNDGGRGFAAGPDGGMGHGEDGGRGGDGHR